MHCGPKCYEMLQNTMVSTLAIAVTVVGQWFGMVRTALLQHIMALRCHCNKKLEKICPRRNQCVFNALEFTCYPARLPFVPACGQQAQRIPAEQGLWSFGWQSSGQHLRYRLRSFELLSRDCVFVRADWHLDSVWTGAMNVCMQSGPCR